jgi:hypothetical protein
MFWKTGKPAEPPKDRVAILRSAIDQAIRDSTIGRDNDWLMKIRIAEALEDFARAVRTEIAIGRSIY